MSYAFIGIKTGVAMKAISRILMLSITCLWLAATAGQNSEARHSFEVGPYAIDMVVTFPPPYTGQPLVFYRSENPQKPLCFSGDGTGRRCMQRFVGAIALVRFSVKRLDGKPLDRTSVREQVTVLSQSKDLPDRPPFSKTIELVDGIGSDIQALGYDESEVKKPERLSTRLEMSQKMWGIYRQELYIGDERQPFAVIEWKHTYQRILLLSAQSATR